MTETGISHLTVVGLGLIGGSFAMLARSVYPDLVVCGVDPDSATLQEALRQSIIQQASLTLPTQWPTHGGGRYHLIVLATHLGINETLLAQLSKTVAGQPVVVTDLGSCKRDIVALGQELLPAQFIGGHPMAGRETAGLGSATELLFRGKRFLMTPYNAEVQQESIARVSAFVQGMGMRPDCLSPEEHDRTMAYVSHLPQLYAILLTNLLAAHQPGRLLSYHGGGIDDQLRLSASPYAMWGDIYRQNADNLREVLDELIARLTDLRHDLDTPALGEWFRISNQMHEAFHQIRQQATLGQSSA